MDSQRLIPLGVIATPHGVRGQVKLRSFTADPHDIISYGPLTDKSGRVFSLRIKGQTTDTLIVEIEGITSREEVEKLRNTELFVPRSALPAPKKNEYYHEDLVGLKILSQDGKPYGIITAVHNFGAGNLVNIKLESGKEEMQPFNNTVFPTIDVMAGTAVIAPPEVIGD